MTAHSHDRGGANPSAAQPRPRIGATTYREAAQWGVWDEPADLLPASYAAAIRSAGGVAVLLPPAPADHASSALDGVHGLLLSGGADVDPARYRAARHPDTGPPRADRDEWELALVHEAIARDLPVLAVCRGLQVLNVALGGDLVQHLPEKIGSDLHCPVVGRHGRHKVDLAEGSQLADIVGATTEIATYHHQGIDRLGADLVACGWAEDGLVEAVELPTRSWVIGVQWHPEAHAGESLFEAFVASCAQRAAVGSSPASNQ